MKPEDKKLIEKFVEKAKELPELRAIILFGSLARGEEDPRSDIDLLMLFECERPDIKYSEKVNAIVSSLKPHREISATLVNIDQYDKGFIQNVLREGKPLFGSIVVSVDNLALAPLSIISYDLSRSEPSVKQKIVRAVHGYVSKKKVNEKEIEYKYAGFKDQEGVRLISSGALILPEEKADGFVDLLSRLGVSFKLWRVWA
ncbi:MAG: nucleotidyltransferase domain-containing protein [Candidatus Micrarchaeota archaeon]